MPSNSAIEVDDEKMEFADNTQSQNTSQSTEDDPKAKRSEI